jgi:cytochrome c553
MTRTDRSFKPRIARTPPPSWWGRALYAVSTLWRRGDEKSLQALAALDDDEVENLSEYGQRLRVAARGAEERRRAGQWRQSPHA